MSHQSAENKCTETLDNPQVRKWPILHVALRISDAEKKLFYSWICAMAASSLIIILIEFSLARTSLCEACYLFFYCRNSPSTDCGCNAAIILLFRNDWNKTMFFFSSSGNISVFPSLLQQSDDSNCILLPIQHITYNFYHLFFLISRFVCLRSSLFYVVCSQVRCACIMYIIAVSYAKSIKCTWDRHCLYFFTTLLCYYVVHFTYYWQ